jgi:hypothetical protein
MDDCIKEGGWRARIADIVGDAPEPDAGSLSELSCP